MLKLATTFFFLVSSSFSAMAQQSATTAKGEISNDTVYFTEVERVRHSQFTLSLNQKATIIPYRLTTFAEIRARSDAALADHERAPNWEFSDEVVKDEREDVQVREAYIDYLGDKWKFKFGIQKIDWIDSISPGAMGVVTALDLRHGAFGNSGNLIEPIGAALITTKVLSGNLEMLGITHPAVHRLPKGDNAYGYQETVQNLFPTATVVMTEDQFDSSPANREYGFRWLLTESGYDISLFALNGHERFPALAATAIAPGVVQIDRTHPEIVTYGASASTSGDAYVFRSQIIYQPKHSLPITYASPLQGVERKDGSQEHSRLALGFDYVESKHFKFYSEALWTHVTTDPVSYYDADSGTKNKKDDYVLTTKFTNESFENVLIGFTASHSMPNKSAIYTPSVEWTFWESYIFNAGWRRIISLHEDSQYHSLRNASQAFAGLTYKFSDKALR
jgi:hypothetical protein